MAEDTQAAGPKQGETPEVDYKAKYEQMRAHMREQEKRAKENAAAAAELEQLKAERMTETERLQKQLEDARAEAASLKAERERKGWVADAARATGVPADLLSLMSADSADELMEKAESLKEKYGAGAGPEKPQTVPVVIGDGKHASAGDGGTANDWLRSTIPGHRN